MQLAYRVEESWGSLLSDSDNSRQIEERDGESGENGAANDEQSKKQNDTPRERETNPDSLEETRSVCDSQWECRHVEIILCILAICILSLVVCLVYISVLETRRRDAEIRLDRFILAVISSKGASMAAP